MITDDKTAICDVDEFQALPEYSISLPSMTTIGKLWKSRTQFDPVRWELGEYAQSEQPGMRKIIWRELIVIPERAS